MAAKSGGHLVRWLGPSLQVWCPLPGQPQLLSVRCSLSAAALTVHPLLPGAQHLCSCYFLLLEYHPTLLPWPPYSPSRPRPLLQEAPSTPSRLSIVIMPTLSCFSVQGLLLPRGPNSSSLTLAHLLLACDRDLLQILRLHSLN